MHQLESSSFLASSPRATRHWILVAGGPGARPGAGAGVRAPLRMGSGRAVVAGRSGRQQTSRNTAWIHSHAWSVASYGVVRTGRVRAGIEQPSLCIYKCLGRRPNGLPGPQGASSGVRRQGWPCVQPGRGPTTDRLITPFTRLRAQSGPRRVSPLNFSRGSGSIQRLLWLRGPSDLQE